FHRNNKHGQNPSYGIRWNSIPRASNDPTKARGEVNSNDFESYGVVFQHSQRLNFLHSNIIAGGVADFSTNDYASHRIDLNAQLDPTGKFVEQFTIAQDRPDLPIADYNGNIINYAAYIQYDL